MSNSHLRYAVTGKGKPFLVLRQTCNQARALKALSWASANGLDHQQLAAMTGITDKWCDLLAVGSTTLHALGYVKRVDNDCYAITAKGRTYVAETLDRTS